MTCFLPSRIQMLVESYQTDQDPLQTSIQQMTGFHIPDNEIKLTATT